MRAVFPLWLATFALSAYGGYLWQQELAAGSLVVVGVRVSGREVAVAEGLATAREVCLPVGEFARATGASWKGEERRLTTPLGEVVFTQEELVASGEGLYLCPGVALARLGVVMSFDPAEVVVDLDVPWEVGQPAVWVPPRLVPEVRAPGWGLGTVRGDVWLLREGTTSRWHGSALATGRALGGEWRVLVDQGQAQKPALRELLWLRRWGRQALVLGRVYQQLSPLLSGYDLLGAQWVLSNDELPKVAGNWGTFAVATALRSFRGPAPVGSLVRLRLDGVVVASQTVGVSGRYEFVDIPVGGRGVAVAEVEIYDRHNLLVPTEVRRELVSSAALLLPEGRRIHALGLGVGGNLGRDLLRTEGEKELTAFYSLRWGVSSRLTMEVLAQLHGERQQVGMGLAAVPKPWWLVAGEAGYGNGGGGYLLESYIFRKRWEVTGRFLQQDRDFALLQEAPWDRHDRAVEIRRFWGKWLELGMIARDVTLGEERARWVRPSVGVSWGSMVYARVFPDYLGDMVGILTFTPHSRLRLAAAVSHTQTYDAQWELPLARPLVWRTTWETGGPGASRLTTTVGNRPATLGALSWRLGVSRSGPHTGGYLEASLRLAGGLFLRAEYQGVPTRAVGQGKMRPRLFISLTADHGYASGLFAPSGGLPVQRETGAIAGRLVALGAPVGLAGARVVVRGVGGVLTDPQGRFFLGSVPPGIYEVELDPEKLPVELSPKRWRVVVEVLAGVTTRVDFPLEVLVGLAGRVTDVAGSPVPGLRVELRDEGQRSVRATTTDQFGLFRFDQLPVGSYTLVAVGAEGQLLATRSVELREFLFDQDLVLSTVYDNQSQR